MLELTEYIKILISLIAVTNPIGAIPIFISLTPGEDIGTRQIIAKTTAMSVSLILLGALLAGEWLLSFFGISIHSFRVGGGILILLMAISMLHARVSPSAHTREEDEESDSKESIAIVPLSIPLLAGPGAMSTVILNAHKESSIGHYSMMSLEILVVCTCVWTALYLAPFIAKRLGKTGINIVTRIMGLILTAIAVEFIANGLKGLFPVLIE